MTNKVVQGNINQYYEMIE